MSITRSLLASPFTLLAIAVAVVRPAPVSAQSERPLERVPDVRRAYVPVGELESVLVGDDRGVLLSKKDFDALLERARTNATTTPRTNAAIVFRDAAFRGRVEGDRLVLEGDVELEQFREGWASFPLGISGLAIESARIGDDQARLGRASGKTTLLHEGTGPLTLRLVLSAPLASIGSDVTAGFQLPGGTAATLEIDLPAGKRLLLDGGRLERPAAIEQATTYAVPVGGTGTRLTITDRADDSGSDVLLFATTAAGLNVVPGEITWQAITSIDVHGRAFDELVFAVPRTLEIAGAESTGLESWRLDDDPEDADVTLVTLRYRQAFDGARKVTLRGVLSAASGDRWTVPTLSLRGANSHVTRIAVRVPRDVRLEAVATDGVRSVAANTSPRPNPGGPETYADASTRRLVFDAFREDFTLEFSTTSKPSSFQANLSTVVTVLDDRWELLSVARLAGRFGATFDIEAELPASWEVTDIRVDGAEATWQEVPREAGLRTVRITLPEPLEAGEARNVEIAARSLPEVWPPTVAPVEVPLPEVRIPAATSLEAAYVVLCSDWFDCDPLELVGLDPVPTAADAKTSQNDRPADGVSLKRLAYVYQNGRISGRLRLLLKPARAAVRTLAFHRIDEDAERTHLEMDLGITGGGLREWTISLPERLGDQLQFRVHQRGSAPVPPGGVRIVEQVPREPVDGVIDWTLRFDRRVRGSIVLAVDVEFPRREEPSAVPVPAFPQAERHHGYVALEATGRQKLASKGVDANDQPLWEITPTELPPASSYVPRERVVTALRFVLPGAKVAVAATRFDRVGVPNAVCQRMEIETALGGGELQRTREANEEETDEESPSVVLRHHLQATLATSSLTMLGISLPEGATIWSATVDGEPIELERDADVHALNWPVGEPNELRTLDVHYVTTGDSLDSVDQPAPRLLLPGGEPIEVLRYDWRLHHPIDSVLVRSRGAFEPTSALGNLSLLGELRIALGRVSLRRATDRLIVLVVITSVVFLLTMAIRQWGPLWPLVTAGTLGVLGLFILGSMFVASGGIGGAANESVARSAGGSKFDKRIHGLDGEVDEWGYVGDTRKGNYEGDAESLDSVEFEASGGFEDSKPMAMDPAPEPEPTSPFGGEADTPAQAPDDPFAGNDDDFAGRNIREQLERKSGQPVPTEEPPTDRPELSAQERLDDELATRDPFGRRTAGPEGEPRFGGRHSLLDWPETELDPGDNSDLLSQLEPRRAIRNADMPQLVDSALLEANDRLGRNDADTAARVLDRATAAVRSADGLDPAVRDELTRKLRSRRRAIEVAQGQLDQRDAQFAERWAKLAAEGRDTGARLSVPLVFEAPAGPSQEFQYIGTDGDDARLVVSVVDRNTARTWCLVAAAVVLLTCWVMRRLNVAARTLIVLVAFTLAFGFGPLVDASLQPALEGLLLGTLGGLVLWGLVALHDAVVALAPPSSEPTGSTKTTTAALLLAILFAGGTAGAEDQDGFEPSQQPQRQQRLQRRQQFQQMRAMQPNQQAANPNAAPANDNEADEPDDDWTVIVPYEPGTDPLDGDRVVVPRPIFVRLWNTAHPDDPLDAGDPPAAVVSSATYTAKLEAADEPERTRVAVTATFVVHGFEDPPTPVVLPVGRVAVRSARIGDRTLPVRPAEGGVAVELGAGRHEVVLEFAVPARTAGPSGRFTFHVPSVPAGALSFARPGEDLLIRVDGAANTFRLDGEGDAARILVPFGTRSGSSTVEWRPRTDEGVGDAIVQVDTRTTLEMTDAGVLATSTFRHLVRRGQVTELRFAAPESVPVRRIVGKDVGGWSFDGEGDERRLSVLLRRAVDDETTVDVELFIDGDPTSKVAALPAFAPVDVARESGVVGVRIAPHLVAKLLRSDGLERSDLEEFGTNGRNAADSASLPLRFAFRYTKRPLDLAFEVSRRPSSVEAIAKHSARVGRHEVLIDSRLTFQLGPSPRQRLVVSLPEAYVPLEVRAVSLDDWYTRTDGGERQLVVEFESTRAGEVEVVLRGEVRRAEGENEVGLVVPMPTEVVSSKSTLGVFVEEGLRSTLETTGGWKQIAAERVDEDVSRRGRRGAELVIATEETSPIPATVVVRPAVAKWSGGDVLNLLTVDDDKVSSVFVMEWRFAGAAADRFVFTAPEDLVGRLEFVRPSLRQVETSDAADGFARWTLHAERPVTESFLVVARSVAPPPAGQLAGPVPVLEASNAKGDGFDVLPAQNRYAVAVNGSLQETGGGKQRLAGRRPVRLDLVPNDGLEPVQVRDISFLGNAGDEQGDLARATTLVRLRNRTTVPTWRVTTSAQRQGGAALVQLAGLTTIFDADGTWRGRGVYRMTNRDRQFLALEFPDGVRPLAAHVRGKAVTIVRTKLGERSIDMVPIPLSTTTESSFDVTVVYSGTEDVGGLERAFGLVENSLQPPAPRVVPPEESAEYGIPVSQTTWTVYLPKGLSARADEDGSRNSFTMVGGKPSLNQVGVKLDSYYTGEEAVTRHRSQEVRTLGDRERGEQQFELANDLYEQNFDAGRSDERPAEEFRYELNQLAEPPGEPMNGEGKPGEGQPGQGQPRPGAKAGGKASGGWSSKVRDFKDVQRELRAREVQDQVKELESRLEESQRANDLPNPEYGYWEEERYDESKIMGGMAEHGRIVLDFELAEQVAEEAVELRPGNGPADAARFGPDGKSVVTSSPGSLSLDFELPTEGTSFTFTKAGGDPKLGILIRRDDAAVQGVGIGWAAAWVALLIAACIVVSRGTDALVTFVFSAITVLGAAAFLLVQGDLAVVGLVVFLVGAVVICVRFARRPETIAEG